MGIGSRPRLLNCDVDGALGNALQHDTLVVRGLLPGWAVVQTCRWLFSATGLLTSRLETKPSKNLLQFVRLSNKAPHQGRNHHQASGKTKLLRKCGKWVAAARRTPFLRGIRHKRSGGKRAQNQQSKAASTT